MPSADIRERIRHFFMARGAVPDDSALGDLNFRLDEDTLALVLIEPSMSFDRASILGKVMKAAEISTKCSLTYLALPRIIAPNYDAKLLQTHGVGLIVYDDRSIDESLPPRRNELLTPTRSDPELKHDQFLKDEVQNLRSQLLELRSQLTSLREEFARLQEIRPEPQTMQAHVPAPGLARSDSSTALPDFFANNPWIDMLARRGREPYAG